MTNQLHSLLNAWGASTEAYGLSQGLVPLIVLYASGLLDFKPERRWRCRAQALLVILVVASLAHSLLTQPLAQRRETRERLVRAAIERPSKVTALSRAHGLTLRADGAETTVPWHTVRELETRLFPSDAAAAAPSPLESQARRAIEREFQLREAGFALLLLAVGIAGCCRMGADKRQGLRLAALVLAGALVLELSHDYLQASAAQAQVCGPRTAAALQALARCGPAALDPAVSEPVRLPLLGSEREVRVEFAPSRGLCGRLVRAYQAFAAAGKP